MITIMGLVHRNEFVVITWKYQMLVEHVRVNWIEMTWLLIHMKYQYAHSNVTGTAWK